MKKGDVVNQTFSELVKSAISEDFIKRKLPFVHLFIFDCKTDNRQEIFDSILAESSWTAKDTATENPNFAYEYVLVEPQTFTARKLFHFIQENKTKVLIFNDDSILKSQALVNIIEGAVCSSPETGTKWPVRFDNEPEFLFIGNIIFLTEMTMYKFKRLKKYFYICRAVMKI